MSNQEHEFLNKDLKEEFDSVLGGILDEEFNEKEKQQDETKTPEPSTSSPSKEVTDDEFDFSQFSTLLDEIEEEATEPTKEEIPVPTVEEAVEVTFQEKENVQPEPTKQETEQSFLFNLDDLDGLDDELLGEDVEEKDHEEALSETAIEQFDLLPNLVVEEIEPKVEAVIPEAEVVAELPIVEDEVPVSPVTVHPSSSSFESIQLKLARIQQANIALEQKKQRDLALEKEVKEASQILLHHIKPSEISYKGTLTNGALYGPFTKFEKHYATKGVFLTKSDRLSTEEELSAIELWLLSDGTFVEYHYVAVKDEKTPHFSHAQRDMVEDVPNLEAWGLETILESMHMVLENHLEALEQNLLRP